MTQAIDAAKVRGLREALERDHVVRFKTGSQVEFEDCTTCGGAGERKITIAGETEKRPCERCVTEGVLLCVERPAGGIARFPFDDDGLRAAYLMAQVGPRPKAQPSGDGSRFGETAPW